MQAELWMKQYQEKHGDSWVEKAIERYVFLKSRLKKSEDFSDTNKKELCVLEQWLFNMVDIGICVQYGHHNAKPSIVKPKTQKTKRRKR